MPRADLCSSSERRPTAHAPRIGPVSVSGGKSARKASEPPTEIEQFLAAYPPRIAEQALALRKLVRKIVPTAVERVRPGWKLIGYDLPVPGRGTYFAWVWPEVEHVHL